MKHYKFKIKKIEPFLSTQHFLSCVNSTPFHAMKENAIDNLSDFDIDPFDKEEEA